MPRYCAWKLCKRGQSLDVSKLSCNIHNTCDSFCDALMYVSSPENNGADADLTVEIEAFGRIALKLWSTVLGTVDGHLRIP
jgi:hypothetical protein